MSYLPIKKRKLRSSDSYLNNLPIKKRKLFRQIDEKIDAFQKEIALDRKCIDIVNAIILRLSVRKFNGFAGFKPNETGGSFIGGTFLIHTFSNIKPPEPIVWTKEQLEEFRLVERKYLVRMFSNIKPPEPIVLTKEQLEKFGLIDLSKN